MEKGDRREFERRFTEAGGTIKEPADLMSLGAVAIWLEPGVEIAVDPTCKSAPSLWEAHVTITRAEYAVAETGSVVIAANESRPSLASLSPDVHVVLIWPDQIVQGLEEAISQTDGTFSLITGPSRTADIEGVLVRGAHGPRELWLIWID